MTFGDLVRGICASAIVLWSAQGVAQNAPAAAPPLSPPTMVDPGPTQTAPVQPVPPDPADAAPATPQHPDAISGEQVVLNPMPVLTKSGSASWSDGFDAIVAALKAITAELDRMGLQRAGDVMVAYNSSDDAGFEFEAQIPFSGATTEKPQGGVALGASYSGRALKFVHKGSFADMDNTYEAVANYLDARNIEAQDLYVERYKTDPVTTPPEALEVEIYVPLR